MSVFNAEEIRFEAASALEAIREATTEVKYPA